MQLTFKISGQRVAMFAPDIVADTIGYFDAVCTFTEDWNGISKWMHLVSPLGEKTDFKLVGDKASGLNLTEGRWEVWFHGNEMTAGVISTRIVTKTISFVVSSSGVSPDGPLPKIPLSAAEQIAANAAEALRLTELLQAEYETLKSNAEEAVKLSRSWAVGGTGSRPDEAANNAKYFSEQSKISADDAKAASGGIAADTKTAKEAAAAAKASETASDEAMDQAASSAAAAKASETAASAARSGAETAKAGAVSAANDAGRASQAAQEAKTAAEMAKTGAEQSEQTATGAAVEARSWAVGGTSSRPGEDTNNAKYYAEKAAASETRSRTAETNSTVAAQKATESEAAATEFASSAESASREAKTAQGEAETSAGNAATSAQKAASSEGAAAGSASSAATSEREAKTAQIQADGSAKAAARSEGNAKLSEGEAASSAIMAQSWAVGGTGIRPDEDTNNAEYWSRSAEAAAGGGVSSFNGRSGAIVPETGDYTAKQVGARPENWMPTAEQVGADVKGSAAQAQENLDTHTADNNNPHNVTAVQVGARPVTWNPDHGDLTGRDADNQHPMSAIDGLMEALSVLLQKGEKGKPNGVAELGTNGKVPDTQLPDVVRSFKGRLGAVDPQVGDYTPEMVGADTKGSAAGVQRNLDAHTSNRENPHGVTAEQAGAVPAAEKGVPNGVAPLGPDGKVGKGHLPTQQPLTFTGLASGSYNGESAVTINIPIGRDAGGIYIEM